MDTPTNMSVAITQSPISFRRLATRSLEPKPTTWQAALWLLSLLMLVVALFAAPARAAVDLRVESRPISDPIGAYVTVTDANGNPVANLTGADFTLTLDGTAVTVPPEGFSQPPSVNPAQNVSVVFVMDYSPSTTGDPRDAMEDAVIAFINAMTLGDYAAIVKFNGSNPNKASVVKGFSRIDGGQNTADLIAAADQDYLGSNSNIYDAINVALNHFAAPPAGVTLPDGPRAIVLISDGVDNASVNTMDFVINKASSLGIPLFTVAVGTPGNTGSNVMNSLAARTGGDYISAPSQAEVTEAYETISTRLDNGYLLSFDSSITDCAKHSLTVTVSGQSTTTEFTRCDATTGPVTVPNVVGQPLATAESTIEGAGLVVGAVTQQSSATVAAGSVISQNPAASVGVSAGSAVHLVVSTGPAPTPGPVQVPGVVGLTQAAATTAIESAGLVVGTVTQQSSTTVAAGSVISQSPGAGTSVAAGSSVGLVVSTGPVSVPNVVNMTQAAATSAITAAGLAVGAVSQQSHATVPSGSVISQSPGAGTGVAGGSSVALVMSTGPTAPPPPPPSGGGGGGGGGALGLLELLAGLGVLAAARRRRSAPMG